jgi:hypothetical protein
VALNLKPTGNAAMMGAGALAMLAEAIRTISTGGCSSGRYAATRLRGRMDDISAAIRVVIVVTENNWSGCLRLRRRLMLLRGGRRRGWRCLCRLRGLREDDGRS